MTTKEESKTQQHAARPEFPGLEFRFLGERPDYDALAATVNASMAADKVGHTVAAQELKSFYSHLEGFDIGRDVLTAWQDDQMVAESYVVGFHEQDGPRVFFTHAYLRPEWRQPGLLETLVDWAEAHALELQRQRPPRPARLRSVLNEGETDLRQLLEARGFEVERYFYTMVRPHLDDIQQAPCPPGIEIRPVEQEHYPQIWQAKTEAFQGHWGTREMGEDDYQRWLANPIQDPALWQVAWDGDEVAGMVLNFIDSQENQELGRKRGYTEDISVRRPWRRQGLASHLIARSLALLRDQGMEEAALGVDVDNPSGALGLYEHFGYEVVSSDRAYGRPLPEVQATT